jgi:hypothetical protein
MKQLVLIHGRAQEGKDSAGLKQEWIDAFKQGLAAAGTSLPIDEERIHFPYYGDTLVELVAGMSPDEVAEVVVRGEGGLDDAERDFMYEVLLDAVQAQGIKVAVPGEADLSLPSHVDRGLGNLKLVRAIAAGIDSRWGAASAATLLVVTHDVHVYLKNVAIAKIIDDGVRQALPPNSESVIVSHSLGTVIAYKLLKTEGAANGWRVPAFITLGSPLAVTSIRNKIKPTKFPDCIIRTEGFAGWLNARDPKDIVALYPLDNTHFATNRSDAIVNYSDVSNPTSNHHGISGYLTDPRVALAIRDVLL